MGREKVSHDTVVIERVFKAAPAKVFKAWSTQEALRAWSAPGDANWTLDVQRFDFRVGGGETSDFGPRDGERYYNEGLYLDIVEDERIVSAFSMSTAGRRFFAGLMTAEFNPEGAGCRLKLTEQGVHFGVDPEEANHRAGWEEMFDKLESHLAA